MIKSKYSNLWTAERMMKASENLNQIMQKTWYCVGSSDRKQTNTEVFWESNDWVEGKSYKFKNHTVTKTVGKGKPQITSAWKGYHHQEKYFAIRPATKFLDLVQVDLPFKIITQWMSFPNQEMDQLFWTYTSNLLGNEVVFVFALTPHVSDKELNREFKRLREEHNVQDTMYKIPWDKKYKLGSTGEMFINAY